MAGAQRNSGKHNTRYSCTQIPVPQNEFRNVFGALGVRCILPAAERRETEKHRKDGCRQRLAKECTGVSFVRSYRILVGHRARSLVPPAAASSRTATGCLHNVATAVESAAAAVSGRCFGKPFNGQFVYRICLVLVSVR